jgi:hypothetical protein
LHTGFWKAINDTLAIEHEYTFFEIINLILEKEPKELDAYFNSLINPPAPENVNNDMSVARRGGPVTGMPPKGGPPSPPLAPSTQPAGPPVPPRPSGLTAPTGDPSEINNNASSTMPSVNNNNRNRNFNNVAENPQPINNATTTLIKSLLFAQNRFYERYLVNNRVPEPGHLRDLYQTLKAIERSDKPSYDAAIQQYITLTRNRPHGGGRYTLKNHKKINYAF